VAVALCGMGNIKRMTNQKIEDFVKKIDNGKIQLTILNSENVIPCATFGFGKEHTEINDKCNSITFE
jgi:hypothetical protein